jgi:protein-disulfide isomerase
VKKTSIIFTILYLITVITQGIVLAQNKTPPSTSEPCGCEEKSLPDVLATVNDLKILKQDVSSQVQTQIEELQRRVVEAREKELDLAINSLLLEKEAKKRGVSSTKLLEIEVVLKVKEPTDQEAQAFYDQNKARINSEFNNIKKEIITHLREERQREVAQSFAERLRSANQIKILSPKATPPTTPADRNRVFATIDNQSITSSDIENSLSPLIFEVKKQVYKLLKDHVELKINDLLLEREAQKRKLTARALLDAEVNTKVPTITETEAQAFYNENKNRINGDYSQVKAQIFQYLQEKASHKASLDYAEKLRKAANIKVYLTEPQPPIFTISIDDQPSKGNPNSSVTIVEFTDYQCVSCAKVLPVIDRILKEYGERVRFVVRDFPLSQHPNAMKAAEAAEAAREQGKYWEYAEMLFRNQSALEVPKLKEYATAIKLDRTRFDAALDSGKFADKVSQDRIDANKIGVSSTPSFYVNGQYVPEYTYESLKASIEAALKPVSKTQK